MPFDSAVLPADGYQRLIRTVKAAMTDPLLLCDDQCVGSTAADVVPGWQRSLQKIFLSAIAHGKPTAADLVLAITHDFSRSNDD